MVARRPGTPSDPAGPRVVSLVPGATEILAALGAAPLLVGRSAECDYPASVRSAPSLTMPPRLDGLSSAEIEDAVAAGVTASTVVLDRLVRVRPDVVISQEICSVCAPSVDEVADALGPAVATVSYSPRRLDDIVAGAPTLGDAVGLERAGRALEERLRSRLAEVGCHGDGESPSRVVALEWLDPPYRVGHWIPDQIRVAGGLDALGRSGEKAEPIDLDAIRRADPEVVILMPCGFGPSETARRAESEGLLGHLRELPSTPEILVADADAHFSRPGPRTVDGVEWLAEQLLAARRRSSSAALR